jgi:hypothetical protein
MLCAWLFGTEEMTDYNAATYDIEIQPRESDEVELQL